MTPVVRSRASLMPGEWGVIAYIVAWYAGLVLLMPLGGAAALVVNLGYFALGLFTVRAQWRAAAVARDAGTRRAWRLIAISSAIILVGGFLWTVLALLDIEWPLLDVTSPFVDVTYLPFALLGLLAFPADPRVRLRDGRVLLDAALFAIVMGLLSWHFALRPALVTGAGLSPTSIIATIGEWGIALAAAFAMLRTRDHGQARAIGLYLAGHMLYIVTDFFWSRIATTYAPGHFVDAIWFSAWVFRWASARAAIRAGAARDAAGTADAADAEDAEDAEDCRTFAPAAAVGAAHILFLLALLVESAEAAVDVALAVAVLTALLLVRQRLARQETQRLLDAAQRESATFEALLESASDFVLLVSAGGRITYASPSLVRAAGPLDDRPFAELLHPDDQASVLSWLEERTSSFGLRGIRCRFRAADGSWRDIELRAQDRRDDPAVLGLVLAGRDAAAERVLEARLGHARKLAMLSEMAGRIAHAFNNTLAVLQAHAEFLAQELPAGSPAREDARAIGIAADRGAGITRQLLGFTGRQVIRTERFVPADVVAQLRPSVERMLLQGQVLTIGGESRTRIEGDRAQFDQVILNLAANARDAMPGGGRLAIVVSDATIGNAPAVRITVQDDGVGMSADVRARLFEPFFTTKAPGRGTGLGLAMVSSIRRRAGGRIEVRSLAGTGTTFELLWPALVADEGPSAPAPRPSGAQGALGDEPALDRTVVLLVDDDNMVRRASKRMLQRAGYEVLEAEDGATGLEIAARVETRIDVLVTDLMMPGLSGRDVIARFRVIRPGTPIVCVTGYAAESEQGLELAPEVRAVVAKPFTSDRLRRALEGALGAPARAD